MTANIGVPNIFPALKYDDAPAAIEWLHKAFGFEKKFVVPGENNTVAHAELRHGAGMIMMGSGGAPDPQNPWKTEPFGVYVRVKDIDAHYARAKAAGAEIIVDIKTEEYGGRGFACRDLEGHIWYFGTYDPWASH